MTDNVIKDERKSVELEARLANVEKVALCVHEDGERQTAVLLEHAQSIMALCSVVTRMRDELTGLAARLEGMETNQRGMGSAIDDVRNGLDAALEAHGHPDTEHQVEVIQSGLDDNRYRLDELERRT